MYIQYDQFSPAQIAEYFICGWFWFFSPVFLFCRWWLLWWYHDLQVFVFHDDGSTKNALNFFLIWSIYLYNAQLNRGWQALACVAQLKLELNDLGQNFEVTIIYGLIIRWFQIDEISPLTFNHQFNSRLVVSSVKTIINHIIQWPWH